MRKNLANIVLTILLATTLCTGVDNKASKSASKAADKTTTIDAWISDERCGANIDAECSKRCVEQGAKLVVVNIKDRTVLPVVNQDSIKGLAGQHVIVTGTMKDGTLTVATVKPAKKP